MVDITKPTVQEGVPNNPFDPRNEIERQAVEDITREMDDIYESMHVNDQRLRQIDLTMFREVFLPWLANDTTRKYPEVGVNHWLAICGNLSNPVELISNQTGEVLAVIPPFYDTNALQLNDPYMLKKREENGPFAHQTRLTNAVITARQIAERGAHKQSQEYMQMQLSGRFSINQSQRRIINAKIWNKIYDLCGREIPYPLAELYDEEGRPIPEKFKDIKIGENDEIILPNESAHLENEKPVEKVQNTAGFNDDDLEYELA